MPVRMPDRNGWVNGFKLDEQPQGAPAGGFQGNARGFGGGNGGYPQRYHAQGAD